MENDSNYYHQLVDIVENAPFPIGVYIGHEMKVVLANKALIRTWGKGDDVIGRSYMKILPELAGLGIYEQLWQVLETGIPYQAKGQRVDLVINGVSTMHYFDYTFTPLANSDGEIYGVMNTAADVTALVLAKITADEAEKKMKMAIENSALGTYEINLLTGNISTSDNFDKMWGINRPNHISELLTRIHPEDLSIRENAHSKATVSKKLSYQVRVLHDSTDTRWLSVNGTYLGEPHGPEQYIFGTVHDITEQKLFEYELRMQVDQRTKELKQSNENLSHFARAVSHDLKEPLRKIRFYSSTLKKSLPQDDKSIGYSEKIDKSAERLTQMIDGVLSYSMLDSSSYSVEEVNLSQVIEDLKDDLELQISQKQAVIHCKKLPTVQGARILLTQLFFNLLANALKFSGNSNPEITITYYPFKDNGKNMISIKVSDNGIGIDNEYAKKIFEPFERLHSKDAFEGNGLGLAICDKIVSRHKGYISAEGIPGRGTSFTVTLPKRQNSAGI